MSIHRAIQSHWLWEDKPFSRGQAWIDLILLANHEDRTIFFDGKPEIVKRGSFLTSTSKLMQRWGWGNRKVLIFLEQLEKEGMLVRSPRKRCTGITLVNYGLYQSPMHRSCTDNCIDACTDVCTDKCTDTIPVTTGVCGTSRIDACTDKCTDVCTELCTQTINTNNTVNNCTVTVSPPENEKIPLTTPPEQREIFRYIQKLKPGKHGADELQYIIDQGVTDQLIRWAVDKAAEKGKLWSYARGILMNCLNSGQKDIPTPKPAKPSEVGWGGNGWEPSYDLDELERRGLMVPKFKEE